MKSLKRKFGLGSVSLILALMGIVWDCTFQGGFSIGDSILKAIGLPTWSNGGVMGTGLHLTIIYSLLFFIPAFLLGNKYKADFGAKAGKIISVVIVAITALFILIFSAR
jgi:hypothetical protein